MAVCARAAAATAAAREGGGRAAGRLSASARCPRSAQTHSSNHVFTKLSGDWVPGPGRSSSLWAEGDAWRGRARDAGCWSWVPAGERRCEPGPGPAAAPRCAAPGSRALARRALGCPGGAVRDAAAGRGEEGGREGGRLPGEECGCVCGREGRPAASCFLSVSAGGGGEG